MLSGVNKGGKTTTILLLATYLTRGVYPDWYRGIRADGPVKLGLCGVSSDSIRDNLSNRLYGPDYDRGAGLFPEDSFDPDKDIVTKGGNVHDQIDYGYVNHVDGGKSWIKFLSYGQRFERVQSYYFDVVLIDEEPEDDNFYEEMQQRVADSDLGFIRLSMTPLHGITPLWQRFRLDDTGFRVMHLYGVDDLEHWSDGKKERHRLRNKGGMNESARLYGIPVESGGMVYRAPWEEIAIDADELGPIPDSWLRIIGIDIPHTAGWFAAASLAYDKTNDVVYMVGEYKAEAKDISIHASRLRSMGAAKIPVAWPHDAGRKTDVQGTATIAGEYRNQGLNMLKESAHMIGIDGKKTRGKLGIIEEISERMATGRFRVVSESCQLFREEKMSYRHEDGVPISKEGRNDIIDAVHKGMMMLRYARPLITRARDAGASRELVDYDFYTL